MIWIVLTLSAALAYAMYRTGRASERNATNERTVENVQKAAEVVRDVNSDPDPVKRLRDNWTE